MSGGDGDELFLAASVDDYVAARGGNVAIKRILVANNGLAAVKAIRSVRDFCYATFGNEHAIQFVAMATPEDIAANAVYVGMADEVYNVPGGTNNHNFANVELIVDIAKRMAVDAVMVGWGHASENPRLADALAEAKIVFVGPPASAMRALGDKIASTIVAQSAAVPTLAWSGDGLQIADSLAAIPDDVFQRACIKTAAQAAECAARIGYPVMIKASEGGGGKGIRKVTSAEDIELGYRQVVSEVPGSPVFLMKLAPHARHLEVQVIGDAHGNAIALFGRDCSVQRRHQKIIEEGPVTVCSVELQTAMEQAAIRLAKQVGYVSAGTVEYLYFDDQFYILELNTRLQVEHPVTEMITGVNVPAVQVQVAMGLPLWAIPDIRRFYGQPVGPAAPVGAGASLAAGASAKATVALAAIEPFDLSPRQRPQGHTIAVRITAENPDEGFKPTSGAITELSFESTPAVWAYFSARSGSSLHEFSDSQFGHLFARAETREAARRAMIRALQNTSIRGEIRTPVEYLIGLLESPEFRSNTFTTAWLDERIRRGMLAKSIGLTEVICGALARAYRKAVDRAVEFTSALGRGQILPAGGLVAPIAVSLIFASVKYAFDVYQSGPSAFTVVSGESAVDAELVPLRDGSLLVYLDGKTHTMFAREETSGLRLVLDSKTLVFSDEFDPSLIRATTPGKIVRLLVPEAAHVRAGQTIAEIEAMKMIMSLVTPADGRISFLKSEGSVLAPGMVIGNLLLDDPSSVTRATPFDGVLPACKPPRASGVRSHARLESALAVLSNVLAGFPPAPPVFAARLREALGALTTALADVSLPAGELAELLSSLASRLPRGVAHELSVLTTGAASTAEFASAPFAAVLDAHERSAALGSDAARGEFALLVAPIRALLAKHAAGREAYALATVRSLLADYVAVEAAFASDSRRNEEVLWDLRDESKADVERVVRAARSHAVLARKNEVVRGLLALIEDGSLGSAAGYTDSLVALAGLASKVHARVALRARHLLILSSMPSKAARLSLHEARLLDALAAGADGEDAALRALVAEPNTLADVLLALMRPPRGGGAVTAVQRAAAKAYVLRTYHEYELLSGPVSTLLAGPPGSGGVLAVQFSFKLPARGLKHNAVGGVPAGSAPNSPGSPGALASSRVTAEFGLKHAPSHSNIAALAGHASSPVSSAGAAGAAGAGAGAGAGAAASAADARPERFGMLFVVSSLAELRASFASVMLGAYAPPPSAGVVSRDPSEFVNTLNVVLAFPVDEAQAESGAAAASSDRALRDAFAALLGGETDALLARAIRRVTLAVVRRAHESAPALFTFRATVGYAEDPIHRNIEPPLAFQLEIARLSQFDIEFVPCDSRDLHVYFARARGGAAWDRRLFVRAIVRDAGATTTAPVPSLAFLETESERFVVDALDTLELLAGDSRLAGTDNNHIFLNFIPEIVADASIVADIAQRFVKLHGRRMFALRAMTTELRLHLRASVTAPAVPVRVVVSSNSGFVVHFDSYVEVEDEVGATRFVALGGKTGPLAGELVSIPYAHATAVNNRRAQAHALDTPFVYDFPELFEQAFRERWHRAAAAARAAGVAAVELPAEPLSSVVEWALPPVGSAADRAGELVPVTRAAGANDIGMVAWLMTVRTPEYPDGQQLVLVANDVSFKMGSFGPREDELFFRATRAARSRGLPRVYVSANSGARIGLADEVKSKFRVAWVDPSRPERGFSYLYLTEADKAALGEAVMTTRVVDAASGEVRWRLTDIVGLADDIGVENLRGSGLIAGETSRAYEDIFTISMVTARSVGIGAYLVRLGQRVVQHKAPPILLTGAGALNKLLGSDVYSSNNQLGGIKIMAANGVTHLIGDNNLRCVQEIVHWLSYIPRARGERVPMTLPLDPVDRAIGFEPPTGPYDPRHMLAGFTRRGGERVTGLFDEGSFKETLGGWARTVVTGRARLGGIPLGVIAVETRTVDTIVPADPANKASSEVVQLEAGQVLFPNSAFKTAQAIADFNHGEQLPLLILSNWRGFSGGMRDMFYEVLKYGSYIVDSLRRYRQPILMYIPPGGELRGGAWVVVDPTISEDYIEMYADRTARGGILEPEGTVEIKYRTAELVVAMHRVDQTLAGLDAELADGLAAARDVTATRAAIAEREAALLPVYHQVGVQFAELHDTPGRMKAKGVITDVVDWPNARRFFAGRLRRRMAVHYCANSMVARAGEAQLGYADATRRLAMWAAEDGVEWASDDAVTAWIARESDGSAEGKIEKRVREMALAAESERVSAMPIDAVINGLKDRLRGLSAAEREAVVARLLA